MIEKVITISLIITAIHVSMWDGMIFNKFRLFLEKYIHEFLHKPFFECLICMGGIYSLLLYPIIYHSFDFVTILIMLQVIGLNTIISGLISRLYD